MITFRINGLVADVGLRSKRTDERKLARHMEREESRTY